MVKKKSFGLLIRESRIKNGFGQRELAIKIGVAASYLNDIEKEKRSAPKQIVIKKLSKLYNFQRFFPKFVYNVMYCYTTKHSLA